MIIKNRKSKKRSRITTLDNVFSKFIRLRDTKGGFGQCISCGKLIKYEDCDCGHYINRKHMSTRFDEINCNAQCRSCNRFDEGNIQGYRRGLIKKYGISKTDMLEIKKHNTALIGPLEIEFMIKLYNQKIKEFK